MDLKPVPEMSSETPGYPSSACFGYCSDCDLMHELPIGNARSLALEIMSEFESIKRLDYTVPVNRAESRLSFENLFPPGHGNMFGVLECLTSEGETVVLRAFSSLRDGIRQIEGWVLPLLSRQIYQELILPAQAEIKRCTAEMEALGPGAREYEEVLESRKAISHDLWQKMCAAYRFRNFRGEQRSLEQAVLPGTPITGGMGECCAPKLLNHAAREGLRPVGLAEFYWGNDPQTGKRVPGQFYSSCEARCQPILGFLLCGVNK